MSAESSACLRRAGRLVAPLALVLFASGPAATRAGEAAKAPRGTVDLNHATLLELMQLPGVGASRAQAIVEFRSAHPFVRTADLLRIKGIGRKLFARLRPFVTVGPPPAAAPSPSTSAPAAAPAP